MVEKRWIVKPEPEKQLVLNLQNAINASETLAKLLLQRGVSDFDSARRLFNPQLAHTHPPMLMKDMDKAVKRITEAIENSENILVYGDYDVDGTSSVAMMYSFLQHQSDRVSYYIPDRYDEGYGISFKGVDFAADNDISLIIALDCGIKEAAKIDYATERSIDFIICDHHLPGETIPRALAILNPLQKDCEYPYKYLSGCGIGFKLIQALCTAWKLDPTTAYQYLDLVAIAAASDIVPMTGENRTLTHFGLKLMQEALRPGLKLLLDSGGLIVNDALKRNLTVTDLVFVIGPRINAAGRMAHGQMAVELLSANTTMAAEIPAKAIIQNNVDRREVDLQILDEALSMLNEDPKTPERKSNVLFANHWHKGVVGIVASRIQDHYYRPTIVLTESNGKVTGSARSVRDFDVHAAIEKCADLLVNFGGHPAAAGMTMNLENLEAFKGRFEESVSSVIDPEQLIPSLEVDLTLEFDQITKKLFENINRLAPFGPQNMRPTFVSHNVYDTGKSRVVGADNSHLKLEIYQKGNAQSHKKGIAFGLAKHLEKMQQGLPFSLVYVLEENVFNGYTNLELMVKDIRFTNESTDKNNPV